VTVVLSGGRDAELTSVVRREGSRIGRVRATVVRLSRVRVSRVRSRISGASRRLCRVRGRVRSGGGVSGSRIVLLVRAKIVVLMLLVRLVSG